MNTIVEEIKKRKNIAELAQQLGLQPTKGNFIFSIYKKESNRSLKLFPKTNSFFCFATGRGGDVINFYADYKKIENKEAIKLLAEELGIDIKNDKQNNPDSDNSNNNPNIEIDNKKLIDIYQSLETFCGGVDDQALQYLTGPGRGLTEKTIKKFRLFSIMDVKATIDHLLNSYDINELIDSGLFNPDRKFIFRNHRLIIPYIEKDQIVYLRGRLLQ